MLGGKSMHDFWYFIILLVVAFIGLNYFLHSLKKKNLEKIKEELKLVGEVESVKEIYDFNLKVNNESYMIKVIYAANLKEVSFNSKKHWQVSNSSGSKMLDTKGFEELTGRKIVLIYPKPERVLRYINENEVVFVKPSMDVFGMTVLSMSELTEYFKTI